MLFDFDAAKVMADDTGGWLCLKVKNLPMARQFVFKMLKRMYTAEVKEFRKKRSRDANGYFWHLCGEMADVLRTEKDAVYYEMLRRYGRQVVYRVLAEASPLVLRAEKHAEVFDTSEISGVLFHDIRVFVGSSHYDARQMSVLIDGTVSECKELGVETATPEEQALFLEAWTK